jgi:hypothetical protein
MRRIRKTPPKNLKMVVKANNDIATILEDADKEKLKSLMAAIKSIDQILENNAGKMPKRDLVILVGERRKAVDALEGFTSHLYKNYDLNEDVEYGMDPLNGEVMELPKHRPVFKIR